VTFVFLLINFYLLSFFFVNLRTKSRFYKNRLTNWVVKVVTSHPQLQGKMKKNPQFYLFIYLLQVKFSIVVVVCLVDYSDVTLRHQ
jgi:hypothetical protein